MQPSPRCAPQGATTPGETCPPMGGGGVFPGVLCQARHYLFVPLLGSLYTKPSCKAGDVFSGQLVSGQTEELSHLRTFGAGTGRVEGGIALFASQPKAQDAQ